MMSPMATRLLAATLADLLGPLFVFVSRLLFVANVVGDVKAPIKVLVGTSVLIDGILEAAANVDLNYVDALNNVGNNNRIVMRDNFPPGHIHDPKAAQTDIITRDNFPLGQFTDPKTAQKTDIVTRDDFALGQLTDSKTAQTDVVKHVDLD